jgi:hypothetical protein
MRDVVYWKNRMMEVEMVESWPKRDDPRRIAALAEHGRRSEEARVLIEAKIRKVREGEVGVGDMVRWQPPAKHGKVVGDDGKWWVVETSGGHKERWHKGQCERLKSRETSGAVRRIGAGPTGPGKIYGDGDI